MSFVSRLLERQRQRRATARHYQPQGAKNAACAKPRSGKQGRRGRPGVPHKTTPEIALVTCENCRVAARLVGVLFAVIALCACGDDRVPPRPDAGVYHDACDPTVSKVCSSRQDASVAP